MEEAPVSLISSPAQPAGDVMRRLRELEQAVQRLQTSRRLESASIGAGGLTVKADGSIRSDEFDGDLERFDPGSRGWALGNDAAVFATLVLRDRLITDDALAKPVDVGGAGASSLGFGLSTTGTDVVTAVVEVPVWAGRALVWAWANASVGNQSGSADFGYIRAAIDGTAGGEMYAATSDGSWSNIFASAQRVITDESLGSTISVACRMRSNSGSWPALGPNIANVDAAAIFLP
jgi:hypothetical protein